MDQNLAMNDDARDFLISLAANGVSSFVAKLGSAAFAGPNNSGQRASLRKVISEALDELSEHIILSETDLEAKCLFLASPESEATVREILTTSLIGDEETSLEKAKETFANSMAFALDVEIVEIRDEADHIFGSVLRCCEAALTFAIGNDCLAAHEGLSAFRHRMLQDQLKAIDRRLESFSKNSGFTYGEIASFESKLRSQINARHGYIVPPNFDTTRKVPICELHVPPRFRMPGRAAAQVEPFGMEGFLASAHRSVVLGDPGGGKSTFAGRVCHDLSEPDARMFSGRKLTPLMVVLRDYGSKRSEDGTSIVDFIESTANSRYQLRPEPGMVEHLVANSSAIVIFDGLDELLDTRDRLEITDDIESFCNLYPECPVIVTSRRVGYDEAPLNDEIFARVHLSDFGESEISQYVHNWFSLDMDLQETARNKKVAAFLRESKQAEDLCSNPLMLSLMCNLYRGENSIPKNRPDLYEKCALMLFERWDKGRGIKVILPFTDHIRPAMMHLAHWIFSNSNLQSGVSERALIGKATNYLIERRFEDRDEANAAATEFIEFCRGRAWVFTDTGTTADGVSLYQFTHRTFLEFFAASHLVRTHATPAALSKHLIPRIAKSEWDVVSQLAFQILNRNVEGAGDALLERLSKAAKKRKRGKGNLLEFSVRSLAFLIPSPTVTRAIVCDAIIFSTEATGRRSTGAARVVEDVGQAGRILHQLLDAAVENRNSIERQISESIKDLFSDATSAELNKIAVEVLLYINRRRHFVGSEHSDAATRWPKMVLALQQEFEAEFRKVLAENMRLAIIGLFCETVDPADVLRWHDPACYFRSVNVAFESSYYIPRILNLVFSLYHGESKSESESESDSLIRELDLLGSALAGSDLTLVPSDHFDFPANLENSLWGHGDGRCQDFDGKILGSAWFALFIVSAIELERSVNHPRRGGIGELSKAVAAREESGTFLKSVAKVLIARITDTPMTVHDDLSNLNLTNEQIEFVNEWQRGSRSFCKPS